MEKIIDCSVCFCPSMKYIKCSDYFCTSIICIECIPLLLNYSMESKIIPKCPSKNCNGIFYKSDLLIFPDLIPIYEKCCFYNIIKNNGTQVQQKIEYENIVSKLRKERLVFIETTFPAGISKAVNVILKAKLLKIEKTKKDKLLNKLKSINKICMNLNCNGILDSDFKCYKCLEIFCKECEQILNDNHKCDENNVETIKMLLNIIKCPKCGVAIEKSQGCNNMTCAICNSHFDYVTGKINNVGNHNQNVPVIIHDELKLSVIYQDYFKNDNMTIILEYLLKIEALKPICPIDIFNAIINLYYKEKINENICGQKLATAVEKYYKPRFLNKKYMQIMRELEKLILNNTLNIENIQKYYNEIQK